MIYIIALLQVQTFSCFRPVIENTTAKAWKTYDLDKENS